MEIRQKSDASRDTSARKATVEANICSAQGARDTAARCFGLKKKKIVGKEMRGKNHRKILTSSLSHYYSFNIR